jgi:hypothetical protein
VAGRNDIVVIKHVVFGVLSVCRNVDDHVGRPAGVIGRRARRQFRDAELVSVEDEIGNVWRVIESSIGALARLAVALLLNLFGARGTWRWTKTARKDPNCG